MTDTVSTTPSDSRQQGNVKTLRQLIQKLMLLLPNRAESLSLLLAHTDVVDTVFGRFVLDSRQLTSSNDYEHASSKHQQTVKDVFILLKSQTQPLAKSQQYAKQASQKAAFILSEVDVLQLDQQLDKQAHPNAHSTEYGCPVIYVPYIRDFLGSLIQLSLLPAPVRHSLTSIDELAHYLPKVIAITGTNGKTTISQLVAQLCQFSTVKNLQNSAVMGTAGNGRLDSLVQATHTTGDAQAVQSFLRQMKDDGVDLIALEASSHGLDQQRLQAVPISAAIYSNLSRDHMDYHPDMADYARAKSRLFDTAYFPTLTHAVINLDDDFAPLMIETANASGLTVWTYSLQADSEATFVAQQIQPSLDGVKIELVSEFGTVWLDSPLLGRFNVANLLAAVAGFMALSADFAVTLADIAPLVRQLQGASGRMQRIGAETDRGCYIVDYAHTPDALTQVLTSLKPHCEGNLWAVFGCGGNRDTGKRPLMAQAGLSVADKVILTSDNPRNEDPNVILEDMQQGMSDEQHTKTVVIADRRDAIDYAVAHAGPKDIVVIAGKGHETYQEINGVRYDFDDREVLEQALIGRQ